MSLATAFILVISLLVFVESLPVGYQQGTTATLSTKQVMNYLVSFGYLPDRANTVVYTPSDNVAAANETAVNTTATASNTTAPSQPETSSSSISAQTYARGEIPRAIGDFQEFMSLKKTMMLDSDTLSYMSLPRCGVEDKTPHASWVPEFFRRRRYVIEGSKWPKTAITYTLTSPSSKLSMDDQRRVLQLAFNRWAEVTPLTFSYTNNQQGADINIRFASLAHGDGKPFDGPGNTLAHAFYPLSGGDVHFDEDEPWVTGTSTVPTTSKSLLSVAVHEIGHSLGLKHSSVSGAVMSPVYQASTRTELADDDIRGAQALYGVCSTSFDTVFSWIGNGKTYFFKGLNTWRFNDVKSESDKRYPKPIQTQWRGIDKKVDEAFLWAGNWATYFFRGSHYYKYNDQLDQVQSGPTLISVGWKGVPDNIDAAFSLNATVSYFFKGDKCYMYDSLADQVFAGYPKFINDCFPGIPNNLDSAVRYYWDNEVYFFKGEYYYKWLKRSNRSQGPYLISSRWRNLCFV